MNTRKNQYAVITGAGKGLGKAYACELASLGYNVILVALAGEYLHDLCEEIEQKYEVNAVPFEADLTQTDEIDRLVNFIESKYNISVLVNNAGYGGSGEFDNSELGGLDKMILLNVRATTWVTHKLLPIMRKNKDCHILNVSSLASFSPFAYKAVYSASKVYVEYLSKALNKEFKQRGVHVSSVHPGPMRTNPEVTMRIANQAKFARMNVLSPEYVAKVSIRRMFNRTSIIVIGKSNRLSWALMKALPRRVVMSLLSYGMKKEIYR